MKNVSKQTTKKGVVTGKQRSYGELIEFLDKHWTTAKNDPQLTRAKKLDQAFDTISKKVKTVLITGTNGKSLTIDFTTQLLKEEGLTVGTYTSPHILTYNERITLNNESIPNKAFVEITNEVINTAETIGATPNSYEILTLVSLLYFHRNNVDVALMEVRDMHQYNTATLCYPSITAVTRVVCDDMDKNEEVLNEILSTVKKGTFVVSGDQSKAHLQTMATKTEAVKGIWAMPIRKLSPLRYPHEQLHGRCAALAERIASIFINDVLKKESLPGAETLLMKQKGQRGRPTLEAKRQSELNPKRTIEQFWKETITTLPGHFQLLEREKPSLLLDTADNLDSFKNLLLGVRLLYYQRPLKGLTLILANNNPDLDMPEFMKALRYFFKKTSGQVIVCPVTTIVGERGSTSWDVEKVTNNIKSMKVKATAASSFKEAFELAKKSVDERNGLVVIAGSTSIVNEYWHHKGIKKI